MSNRDPLLTAAAVLSLAQRWDASAAEVSLLRSGENSTWHVRSDRAGYALRLISKARRTIVQIEGELAFIDHLAAGGVRIARARRTPIGDRVIAVTPPSVGPMYATCFDWLPGRHFEYHSHDIHPGLFRAWGATMARMHQLSSQFILPSGTSRPEWTDDAVAACATTGAAVSPRIIAERDDLVAWLRTTAIESSHYGLVHGDFERTNFLLDGDRIGVVDLDDCCRHWFAWDIACALWAFRHASPADRGRYLGWFMDGYGAIREPDAERMRRFSDLVRLRTIALLLYRLRDPARHVLGVDRDWVQRTTEWLLSDWRW
jgi:Ser/Thr protein kinase RdoA (MazF antagonist)